MRFWNLIGCVLTSCAAGASLAGCTLPLSPPMAAPGAMPGSAIAAPAKATSYKIIYTFGLPPDGSYPVGSLIDVGGTLYGTTAYGGTYASCDYQQFGGTVFSITPSGTEKVLHTFSGNGKDGCRPEAGLIDVGGTLYGTTSLGGMYGCGYYSGENYISCGTVFSITPGGTEKVLYYFQGGKAGNNPDAPLIDVKGTLYGTTVGGGTHFCGEYFHCGTVFTVTPAGIESVLHSFRKGRSGNTPVVGLLGVGRTLYGATRDGGDHACDAGNGCGTVFSLKLGGKEKTLHVFGDGTDGRDPNALIDVKGTLYGTTTGGGSNSCACGTVFSITPSGAEKVLFSFDNTDGASPSALIDVKGTLYGTTSGGGAFNYGTIFSITTAGKEKVLHSFRGGQDGIVPYGSLVNVKGTLYGTTSGFFGNDGQGTVFALTP